MTPDVQQRLEALKTGFDSFVLKSATIPYEEGIKTLNAKVKPALERESANTAQRKDLDALVRIKAGIERIGKGLPLTDADVSPPDSLKHIYATYKLELAKIESARKASFADAKQRYDKGLIQIQDELTKTQKVEAALYIKELRDGLKSGEMAANKDSNENDGKKEPSSNQTKAKARDLTDDISAFEPSRYFTGKVHSDLDAALKIAQTLNKPVWVIGYGPDDERKARSSRIRFFMELQETKKLVEENFVQVMMPFGEKSLQPLIAKDDNLEMPMLFILNPQGEIIIKRVVNENQEWGLRRTKEYLLKAQGTPQN